MTIRLGRVLGIRISLHVSWFVILALVALGSSRAYSEGNRGLSSATVIAMGITTAVLFFACLLAHELGHALLARRLGVPVRGITLFLLGGVSEIGEEIEAPGEEFAIALAGPAVSAALAGAFALLALVADYTPIESVAASVAVANGFLAVFNLIPGLPLDGGRLLRAGLWKAMGDRRRATRIGVAGGRLLALGLLIVGVLGLSRGSSAGVWYLLMALFLDQAARAAGRQPRRPTGVALPRDVDASTKPGSPDQEAPR